MRGASLDHLVGAGENRGGNVQTKVLGGFQIDHKLVLGRRLHGKLGGLLAFENAIDVGSCTPVLVDPIRPQRHQAAEGDEVAPAVDRGQSVLARQLDDHITRHPLRRCGRHDQATIRGTRECGYGALDLAGTPHVDRAHLHPKRWGQGLHRAELARPGRYGRSLQERHALHARRNLLEQLQPFGADTVFKQHEARSVAARPARVSTKPAPTGSATSTNTTGTVRVACSRGPVAALLTARMTPGASATNSAAYLRMCSGSPAPQRMSIRALRPSIQPDCASACVNARM